MEAFIREAKRKTLSFMHHIQGRVDQRKVNALLENYDMEAVQNTFPERVHTVLFVITRFVRFHGGQTSILRLGTQLAAQGYQVGYAIYKPQSKEEMELCARSNLNEYAGELFTEKDLKRMIKRSNKDHQNAKKIADVIIASSWDTVSYVKKLTGYKMYFVQDYEPYFYSYGELFLLAKKTYEHGLHMVSLGDWNKDMIKNNCNIISPIDSISFPYEKKEYQYLERDYNSYHDKKVLKFAVYLKYYGKRLPCIIQYMMQQLSVLLRQDGITLEVSYFGEAKSFSAKGGRNLGMLSKEEISKLYQDSDFGMVASYSNISLVSYEMPATGLPLIEFEDGTFSDFFPPESALLTSISANDLYQKLKMCLRDPAIIEQRQQNARNYMAELSWERTGKEFSKILQTLVKENQLDRRLSCENN